MYGCVALFFLIIILHSSVNLLIAFYQEWIATSLPQIKKLLMIQNSNLWQSISQVFILDISWLMKPTLGRNPAKYIFKQWNLIIPWITKFKVFFLALHTQKEISWFISCLSVHQIISKTPAQVLIVKPNIWTPELDFPFDLWWNLGVNVSETKFYFCVYWFI